MSVVRLGMGMVLAGALAVVGGYRVGRAGVSVCDAVDRMQAGDVRPMLELLGPPPHGHGTRPGGAVALSLPPAAEVHRRVGDVACFAGLLMGAGPATLLEGYGWTRHRGQRARGLAG